MSNGVLPPLFRINYCKIPIPGIFKTVIGIKDEMKNVIIELLKTDDEFLYYFLNIKRGTFYTDALEQKQANEQEKQAKNQANEQAQRELQERRQKRMEEQAQKQIQNQPQKKSWGSFFNKLPNTISKFTNRIEEVGATAVTKMAALDKKYQPAAPVINPNIVDVKQIENMFLALQIFSDRLYAMNHSLAKYVQTMLEQDCMKVPIAFLIKKLRESPRFIQRQKELQKSIASRTTNANLYEQKLAELCKYIGTAIDRIITPICNSNLSGSFDEKLLTSGLDYFSYGKKYSRFNNVNGCDKEIPQHILDYNKYYSTLQLGGGNKENAINRQILRDKFRKNVRTMKIPKTIYEKKNVTNKRKRVRAKFTKNVQTRRR